MKNILFLLFAFLVVSLLSIAVFGQVTRTKVADDKYIINASNSTYLTTTGSAYTDKFSLTEQDALSWVTYPFQVQFTATVPTTGTIKVVSYLTGSLDGINWTNVDTLKSADSTLSTTPYVATDNFNNKKYPYYRWHFKGQTGNSDSVTVFVKMWNPMKDKFLKP